jgi:hypothetical protein
MPKHTFEIKKRDDIFSHISSGRENIEKQKKKTSFSHIQPKIYQDQYRPDFASKIFQNIFFLAYQKLFKNKNKTKEVQENHFVYYFTGVGPK